MLSDQEIKYLLEKAESCVDLRHFDKAIMYYTQVIENTSPHSHYFCSRACAYAGLACLNNSDKNLEKAIEDINIAIKNDRDDGENYWRKGAFLTYNLSIKGKLSPDKRKNLLEEIIKNFKTSIEKNPTNPLLWLDIIEINIIFNRWDDAIGKYGECQSYIISKEHKLIRAWLGCIAMIFEGDSIQEEDLKPLHDHSIRLNKSHWYVGNINGFFQEICAAKDYYSRCKRANEIHKIFISHFDESLW